MMRAWMRVMLVMLLVAAILLYHETLRRWIKAALIVMGLEPRSIADLDEGLEEALIDDEEDEDEDDEDLDDEEDCE